MARYVQLVMVGDHVAIVHEGKMIGTMKVTGGFVDRITRLIKSEGMVVMNHQDWGFMKNDDMKPHRYHVGWTATAKNNPIITVMARDEADAKAEVRRQLDREGRRDFLELWEKHGCKVVER